MCKLQTQQAGLSRMPPASAIPLLPVVFGAILTLAKHNLSGWIIFSRRIRLTAEHPALRLHFWSIAIYGIHTTQCFGVLQSLRNPPIARKLSKLFHTEDFMNEKLNNYEMNNRRNSFWSCFEVFFFFFPWVSLSLNGSDQRTNGRFSKTFPVSQVIF